MSVEDFRHHLVAAKHKMSAVAARAGRSQYDVQLIAVSKSIDSPRLHKGAEQDTPESGSAGNQSPKNWR